MIEDLKVGDKVYIREDLKGGEFYGSVSWLEGKMKAGISTISAILSLYEHGICISEDIGYFYDAKMIDWEKTRELNAKDNSTFDDLIDLASKALKDGVVKEIGLFDNILMIQESHEEAGRVYITINEVNQNGVCKYLEYINSLYTETFVIESEEDINKFLSRKEIGFNKKSMSVATLMNGNEILITRLDPDNTAGIVVYMRDGLYKNYLGIDVLKGATVTQKRGKQ